MVQNYREFLFIINCGTSECFEINVGGGEGGEREGDVDHILYLANSHTPSQIFHMLNGFWMVSLHSKLLCHLLQDLIFSLSTTFDN